MISIQTEGSFRPKKSARNSSRNSARKPSAKPVSSRKSLPRSKTEKMVNKRARVTHRLVKYLHTRHDGSEKPRNRHRHGSCSPSPSPEGRDSTSLSNKRPSRHNSIKVHRSLNCPSAERAPGVEYLHSSSRQQIIKQVAAECENS